VKGVKNEVKREVMVEVPVTKFVIVVVPTVLAVAVFVTLEKG
jgi:hypothetical protein